MITREEFFSAKAGDMFIDSIGREWRVVHRDGDEVTTHLSGAGEIGLFWDTENSQILDDEEGYLVELNSACAQFISARAKVPA